MSEITATMVKELREKTGAGVMDCKEALQKSSGDFDKAAEYLRLKGIAKASKKAERETKEGLIGAYIHAGGKMGALIEVNCETDFVARNEAFVKLVNELAMQVAAMKPIYVSREEIPAHELEREMASYRASALAEGKPEAVAEKIAQGKLEKFLEQVCLLEQPYIRDGSMKVADLVRQHIATTGENIKVRRFSRFSLGD
ncbi:MAG TPA: translation elongation factor Ts [Candidatus Nitrosotenuis sp.]|jgi:elongation factor Ts|nr:translation elongation factor Ts [Candidatus Nitrosotenuis sp.]